MRKKIVIVFAGIFAILILLFIIAVYLSFSLVKKNTDKLIKTQRDKLISIINIPNAVPPSNPTFSSISYTWEMETLQNEVATINVLQTTGLSKSEESIIIVLEKTPTGDPSVFDKVLPAVIADRQVLATAFSSEKITQLYDGETGFKQVSIIRDTRNDKVVKVVWEFDKNNFGDNAKNYHDKINSLPESILKLLYATQSIAIAAVSGQ